LLDDSIVVVDPEDAVVDADAVVVTTAMSLPLLSMSLPLPLGLAICKDVEICKVVVRVAADAVVVAPAFVESASVAFVSCELSSLPDSVPESLPESLVLSGTETGGDAAVETQTQVNVELLGSGGVSALTVAATRMSMRLSLAKLEKTLGRCTLDASTSSIVGLAWNIGLTMIRTCKERSIQ
jgi:hypothetical protein